MVQLSSLCESPVAPPHTSPPYPLNGLPFPTHTHTHHPWLTHARRHVRQKGRGYEWGALPSRHKGGEGLKPLYGKMQEAGENKKCGGKNRRKLPQPRRTRRLNSTCGGVEPTAQRVTQTRVILLKLIPDSRGSYNRVKSGGPGTRRKQLQSTNTNTWRLRGVLLRGRPVVVIEFLRRYSKARHRVCKPLSPYLQKLTDRLFPCPHPVARPATPLGSPAL
jgi:hypothetical protein